MLPETPTGPPALPSGCTVRPPARRHAIWPGEPLCRSGPARVCYRERAGSRSPVEPAKARRGREEVAQREAARDPAMPAAPDRQRSRRWRRQGAGAWGQPTPRLPTTESSRWLALIIGLLHARGAPQLEHARHPRQRPREGKAYVATHRSRGAGPKEAASRTRIASPGSGRRGG